MTAVGQTYRASGPIDVRSILTTTILGAVVAVVGAGVVWLWEISPIPTLVLLTPILQGAVVGGALGFMIGRLHLRNPRLVGFVGFLCGLLSITLVHYGHHLHLVGQIAENLREQAAGAPPEERDAILKELDAHPTEVVDQVLLRATGHSGFLGTMMLRNEQGVMIKNSTVNGGGLWALWGFEALLVAGAAGAIAGSRAGQPYCEDCHAWHVKSAEVLTVGGGHAEGLVQALRDDAPDRLDGFRAQAHEVDPTTQAVVDLHSCPGCDTTFADVRHRSRKGKETKEKQLLGALAISPEMLQAIRAEPTPPLAQPAPETPA